ncbi:hypothetical protein Slin15195_G095840 [Septoria linicola]|uniref:Uncharacterized protein n=1 Tax=Septoria linicola TaxID=215465 RepID=A0A9Q9EMP4_9PEZI|nr:hypothetical protein Slin14017_G058930 [Septoria linicola]USW56265.1 hypothetical protein Slin15195_G095840 [Septoria linicola]
MMYFGLFLAALTAFVAAIPLPASTSPAAPCPSTLVKENQSTAFGWQLVGTSSDASTLDQTCNQLQTDQLSKWGNFGLALSKVQTPVCNALTSKASDALPKVVAANTKIITNLLTSSFKKDDVQTYGYLCDNLRYEQVSGFLLDDATIINATCNLGAERLNPRPFTAVDGAKANRTAVAAYNDAQSNLYAYLYAAQAGSPEELNTLCEASQSKARQADYEALQLDPDCVSQTICSIKEPISVAEGKEQLKKWTSVSYANVLVHSSNAPGYVQVLCEKLDTASLEAAGLDAEVVKNAACSGSA